MATLSCRRFGIMPPEALDAVGIEAGAELEVEIVGRALVVRSVEEARQMIFPDKLDVLAPPLRNRRRCELCGNIRFSLNSNACLRDGNKRVAAAVTEAFLETNGFELTMDNGEIIDLFLGIASNSLNREQIEELLRNNARQKN